MFSAIFYHETLSRLAPILILHSESIAEVIAKGKGERWAEGGNVRRTV